MLKYAVYILLTTGIFTGSIFLYGEYLADDHTEMPMPTTEEPEVIKVVPQEFPINELSDAWFGKEVVRVNGIAEEEMGTMLSESASPLPDWLDQIVSRESIVAFNQHVLANNPDELQFSQVAQSKYTGTDGWEAFLVEFETSPSKQVIVVLGAYQDENKSFWMSEVLPARVDMTLTEVGEEYDGVVIWGKKGENRFRAQVKKESVVMAE